MVFVTFCYIDCLLCSGNYFCSVMEVYGREIPNLWYLWSFIVNNK